MRAKTVLCCVLITFLLWPLGIVAVSVNSARKAAAAAGRVFFQARSWPLVAGTGLVLAAALVIGINPYWLQAGAKSADLGFRHFCVFATSLTTPRRP